MSLSIPDQVSSVEFWKFKSSAGTRTRSKIMRSRHFVNELLRALRSKAEYLEYFPDSPDAPYYMVILTTPSNRKVELLLAEDVVVTKDASYFIGSNRLWRLLEQHKSNEVIATAFTGEPCFVRSRRHARA